MNQTHILAAYQPNKKRPHISGFGGKPIEGETFLRTALRETLEELFDLEKVPLALLLNLGQNMIPTKVVLRGSYICVIYTFDQLLDILQISSTHLEMYKVYLKIYPNGYPKTLGDLIFKREPKATSEVSHICLLPLVKGLQIDPLFLEDLSDLTPPPPKD